MQVDKEGDERLAFIFAKDQELGEETSEFLDLNPVFRPFAKYAAATRTQKLNLSLRHAFVYYICHAGVSAAHGNNLWERARLNDFTLLNQQKKETINSILDLVRDDMTLEEATQMSKIKHVGPGCISFVQSECFGQTKNIVFETDRVFQRGLQKIYGFDKRPSPSMCKKLTDGWKGNKSIGSLFCFQCAHYAP